MFHTAVSSVIPTLDRHIHPHNMESIRIFIRKEIWKIRRGGQITKIIFQVNRLYSYVPPPGMNMPISVEMFPLDDWVPTEDELEWVVKRL